MSVNFDPVKVEAVSKLIAAMAWPVVVLIITFVFRKPLQDLLGRLRTWEGPGGVKFAADARTVATSPSNELTGGIRARCGSLSTKWRSW